MYNKKSANWYAVPMKVAKDYGYITEIQTEIMRRRMVDRESILRRREMLPGDPRRISRTLAPISPPPTAELVKRHHTRMSKRLASSGQAAHLVADVDVVMAGEAIPDSPDNAAGDDPANVVT